jgi:hypothetical protein
MVKITSEMLALVGAKTDAEFPEKFTAFVTKAKENETLMAEKQVTLESLQTSITALEGKILTEARVKEICGESATSAISTWAGSEGGKKIIGAEASRVVMEASAATGTAPAKPAPTSTEPAAVEKKTFADIVQAGMSSGKTKSAAISAAVESNPTEYKAYLATGGKL